MDISYNRFAYMAGKSYAMNTPTTTPMETRCAAIDTVGINEDDIVQFIKGANDWYERKGTSNNNI